MRLTPKEIKKFIIEDYINEKDQKIFQGYLK